MFSTQAFVEILQVVSSSLVSGLAIHDLQAGLFVCLFVW